METGKLFEKATKMKLRFNYKGVITTEDLWDLTVGELDVIYRGLSSELKQSSEDSLLGTKSTATDTLQLKIEIIKHIANVKVAEVSAKEQAVADAQRKQLVAEIIRKKELAELENMSVEDLKKML